MVTVTREDDPMAILYGPAPLSPGDYMNNTAVGTATASYTFAQTASYNMSSDTQMFLITSGTISGMVRYYLPVPTASPSPGVTPKPVPGVLLSAVPSPTPGSPATSGSTNAGGIYNLTNFGIGAYTVTPSKTKQSCLVTNGIFADDASMVSQHVVGLITLSPERVAAGKVAGLGTLSSFDAALIAQKVVGICSTGVAGEWRFTPTSIPYTSVLTDYLDQNYSAYLMGDVNGDWNNLGPNRPAMIASTGSKDAVKASIPVRFDAAAGTEIRVPITIDNLAGKAMTSYQFDIAYDPDVLEPATIAAQIADTMGDGLSVVSNAPEPGLLKVAVYGAIPVSGDGVYANLIFKVVGAAGTESEIRIADFRFNDGTDEAIAAGGTLVVTSSANGSVLTGRLLTAFGKPVADTTVVLTGTAGRARTATSNSAGQFRFGALTRGGSYTLSVRSNIFVFSPLTVSIIDDLTTLDMIANP